MIKVNIKYFAILRELVGVREEEFSCPEGCTVDSLFALLVEKYPKLQGKRKRLSVAVNHQYASGETVLEDGAEVAFLPPVAGGLPTEEETTSEAKHFDVLETPLDPEELSRLVQGEFGGAIVSFVGMVRRESQGRIVEKLVYEAYKPMAIKEIERIGQEIQEKWPDAKVAIHHRVGSLDIGDLAVVIAVCTPHRQEGFDACSYAIERLKETVPVWKHECFTDGSSWVGWGP